MARISDKTFIQRTFTEVREASFKEKSSPLTEEQMTNSFLDSILELKKLLKEKTSEVLLINEMMEKLTWVNDVDEESLMLLNDLISLAKDFRGSLIRQYISLNDLRKQGLAKDEIKEFKNGIDELKEAYEDLESVFFFLPKMPDFVETTRKLSLVLEVKY